MLRSVAGLAGKLSRSAIGPVLHTVRHPVASTSYAAGMVRGLAAEGIRLASGAAPARDAHVSQSSPAAESVPVADESPRDTQGPQRVPLRPGERHEAELAEAAEVPAPPRPEPEESFANEPHAASRDSAHGDGPVEDALVDRWDEDAEALLTGERIDSEPAPGDEPLLDPSVAKQVRAESATMREAARSEAETTGGATSAD